MDLRTIQLARLIDLSLAVIAGFPDILLKEGHVLSSIVFLVCRSPTARSMSSGSLSVLLRHGIADRGGVSRRRLVSYVRLFGCSIVRWYICSIDRPVVLLYMGEGTERNSFTSHGKMTTLRFRSSTLASR